MNNTRNLPSCACGGGQSCIVDRRNNGDWVHEDDIFKSAGLPVRINCMINFTPEQQQALNNILIGYDSFTLN